MEVNVRLNGILRDKLPPEAKGRTTVVLEERATVADLLSQLGINRQVLVSLNGRPQPSKTHLLQEGDAVAVFTIMGGG